MYQRDGVLVFEKINVLLLEKVAKLNLLKRLDLKNHYLNNIN